EEELAPREGPGPRFGERDRIPFAVDIARIGIHLIEAHEARRHRAQADRRIGAGEDNEATWELLEEHSVAGVPAAGPLHALPQRGALLDERVDAAPREPLRQLDRRLDEEKRAWRVVDHVAEPVDRRLREPELRALHHDNPTHRRRDAERLQDGPEIRRSGRPPAARLSPAR